MNFQNFKTELLKRAKAEGACISQYKRALESESYEQLAEVIKDNLMFNRDHSIVTIELAKECDKPEVWNCGKDNSGLFNSGDLNSGYRNSGDRNSGDRNSGDRNSGDLNSGDRNSGDRNSGDRNSGDRNSGDRNSGDRNSGDRNSGDLNSGYRNSGDLNSGYRNSGVFCTKKENDTVLFFNKESGMTWGDWYNSRAYYISSRLELKKWISWHEMSEEEKKDYPQAFVCEGYIKTFEYLTAWENLWSTLTESEKQSFKTLPNFDPDIFKEITGIDF